MSKVKKLLTLAAAVLLGLGIAVAVTSPAQAAYSDCPTGQGCVWTGHSGTGSRLNLPVGTYGTGTCWTFNVNWGNVISSARATYGSGLGLTLYTSASCVGNPTHPYWYVQNESMDFPAGSAYNDSFKSFKIN